MEKETKEKSVNHQKKKKDIVKDKELTNFYKYPKTPHLQGSSVVDDDEIITLTPSQINVFSSYHAVIQVL